MKLMRLKYYALLFVFKKVTDPGGNRRLQGSLLCAPLCPLWLTVLKAALLREHLIEQLLHRAFRFEYGKAMVHRPRQIGVRECNPPKRASS